MFDILPAETKDILFSIGLCAGVILLTLIVFAWFWLGTTNFYFPLGGYNDDPTHEDKAEGRVKLGSIWKYFKALLKRLWHLDHWYWTRYSGFECKSY